MKENDWRTGGVPRSDIEHIERRPGHLERFPLRRETMFKDGNASLGSQRQHHERGYETHRYHEGNPDRAGHRADTRLPTAGFRKAFSREFSTAPHRRPILLHTAVIGDFL